MNPENFAVPPADALSDLLQAVHLQGGEIVRSATDRPTVLPHAPGTRMLHLVEHGHLRLEFPASADADPRPAALRSAASHRAGPGSATSHAIEVTDPRATASHPAASHPTDPHLITSRPVDPADQRSTSRPAASHPAEPRSAVPGPADPRSAASPSADSHFRGPSPAASRSTGAPSAADPIDLGPGDMALLARGDAHLVHASDAHWVTGRFLVDHLVADPLLSVLPAAIVIRADSPDASWAVLGLELMLAEVSAPGPGSRVMLSRLLDLLFIRSLRVWATSGHEANPGWLTAAMDPAVGPVLSAIHRDPARDWSVDDLAALAALSRSAFATRFAALLGQPPGAYVQRQRLDRAAHLLASTPESVGRIASRVGYSSEAAFSRAFARTYGVSPRAWRKTAPSTP